MPALLRCALRAQVRADHRWDMLEEVKVAVAERHRLQVAQAIAAEQTWLVEGGPEPAWPEFPSPSIHFRGPLTIGGGFKAPSCSQSEHSPSEQLRSQVAAVWVRQVTRETELDDRSWLTSFVKKYGAWTAEANGSGLECRAEIDRRNNAWNNAYFPLAGETCARMPRDEVMAFIAAAIDVPDEPFFDIVEELIPALDRSLFNDRGLHLNTALMLRTLVADRMVRTTGWRREKDRAAMSVETRIGRAIAPLFFCHYGLFTKTRCYLLPKGVDRVASFFPLLTRLTSDGSVPFIGLLTMARDNEPASCSA